MSENFECDFSEGSVNEKKPSIKKRQSEKEIHSSYTNSNNLKSSFKLIFKPFCHPDFSQD